VLWIWSLGFSLMLGAFPVSQLVMPAALTMALTNQILQSLMEQHIFFIYYRGCHWKGIQIVYKSFIMLMLTSSLNLSFFTKTKSFTIMQKLTPLLILSFFLQNLYFVYLLSAALCRLLSELSKVRCSISGFCAAPLSTLTFSILHSSDALLCEKAQGMLLTKCFSNLN
jgi:hypothetical protein